MPFLKHATQGALDLSEKIAEVIAAQKGHTNRYILDIVMAKPLLTGISISRSRANNM
jgi:hypothetical protein